MSPATIGIAKNGGVASGARFGFGRDLRVAIEAVVRTGPAAKQRIDAGGGVSVEFLDRRFERWRADRGQARVLPAVGDDERLLEPALMQHQRYTGSSGPIG
jgi:hypothetical protein